MTTRNDITGDLIASKQSTDAYREGWDAIFSVCKNCGERKHPAQCKPKCPPCNDNCNQGRDCPSMQSLWRKRLIDPGYSGAVAGERDDT